jgi:EAL domain-containing protein (putative c-di-GMP-specific phosphodiesterase class I)
MNENVENIEIVRTIIVLARNLGLDVVAEGVETAEQVKLLRMLRCDYAQGYFFSKPLNPEDAGQLIENVTVIGRMVSWSEESFVDSVEPSIASPYSM